jgi:hypothetical protein
VTEAEAAFVAEILRRHPGSPKPVIVGNCQGAGPRCCWPRPIPIWSARW